MEELTIYYEEGKNAFFSDRNSVNPYNESTELEQFTNWNLGFKQFAE